jgi:hypothetical protein
MIYLPHKLVDLSNAGWSGVPMDYLSAMMLTYYFVHLDQPEKPCATLAGYLSLLRQSKEDVEKHISEHNWAVKEFEAKRLAFNEEVGKYNASVTTYKGEVDAYNERVTTYNTQLRNGVPEGGRVKVGEEPVPPTPPTELVVPEILKADDGQPIDFLAQMKEAARPALFRGRGNEQLDEEVIAAFAGIGIRVAFRSASQGRSQVRPQPGSSGGNAIQLEF